MSQQIKFEIPGDSPEIYLGFLQHLMVKYPLSHPNVQCSFVMKHTKNVGGRPGHFFGSRPANFIYTKIVVALGRPDEPHAELFVLQTIAHEYQHLLQYDEGPGRCSSRWENELAADLFSLREVYLFTGNPLAVTGGIRDCYNVTQKFLIANLIARRALTDMEVA